jgi:hypothetical protein
MLTPDDLKAVVARHTFYQIPETTTIVCQMHTVFGSKVLGYCFGPMDPANFDFEKGCNIAYDEALAHLWELEGYRRLAEQHTKITPVAGVTEDMKLPNGSAVFQIINTTKDGSPHLDMRGVLVGGTEYDPLNPAHRILATINNQIDALVAVATGGEVQSETAEAVENRLAAEQGEPGIVAGYDLSDANLARERHELTETEAARQDKLAALALQYNSSGNPKEHFELADRAEGKGGNGLHQDD